MKKKACVLGVILFITDLLSKIMVINFINDKVTLIPNFLAFTKLSNDGAAFSILTGYRMFFIFFALAVIFYIYKYMLDKIDNKFELVCYAFLLGGIAGNLFDRIFYGEVIDFISFSIFGYMFPIFNLADTFIVIGAVMFVIILIKGDKNEISSKRK